MLLSSALEDSILNALPPQVSGQFTPGGQLVLSCASQPGALTPTYSLLDAHPSLDAQGKLTPFATSTPTGLAPAALRHAYGIDQIKFGTIVGNGAGQTIAIVDVYDYPTAASDLHAFDQQFGLPDPPSFQKVNQSGGSTLPTPDPKGPGSSWSIESALDIEWAHAIAPAANILLVECNSPYNTDVFDVGVNWARSAPGVSAVSMSFGEPEFAGELAVDGLFTTPAGHGGVTYLAASGDNGAPGTYPAFSPNVVAVGGTTLYADPTGIYGWEAAWTGGGGGISSFESQPNFQKSVATPSTTRRTIPDVCFDADPYTGVPVCDSYDFGASTPWAQNGGTSLSAPCWAGLIAIANQNLAIGGTASLDGATGTLPRLYASAPSYFHDVLTGRVYGGYPAAPGYDLSTGLGSPIANTLVPHLGVYGPRVTSIAPTGLQSIAPNHIDFNFSAPMRTTSFSVSPDIVSFTGPTGQNLLSQVKGFSWLNSNKTLRVSFAPVTAEGPYKMVIGPGILSDGGAPMDQNQSGIPGETPADRYTAVVRYDTNPLKVASTTPEAGSTIAPPFTKITLHFNRAYDPATVSKSNLVLSQGRISAFSLVDAQTIDYTISGITLAGTVTIALPFGALNDTCGNPMLAFSGQYNIPVPPAPLKPALLAANDSGVSSSDSITNFDNSSAARALRFSIGNTIAGDLVNLYADGILIGSATATGVTTAITTNGNLPLKVGAHVMTARQGPVGGLSALSAARSITILTTAPALATAGGQLDPTFNGTGTVIEALSGHASIENEALQNDGKTIVVGSATAPGNLYTSMVVARYNVDGTLDTTFAGRGYVIISVINDGTSETARGVAIQPDGKIVVVGEHPMYNAPLIAMRFNVDGSLDNTFGAGGKVIVSLDDTWFDAQSVALQADGKIVIGGENYYGMAIARLTADGALDTSFNGTGYNLGIMSGARGAFNYGLAITSDGRIYACGAALSLELGHSVLAIARFTSSGVFDTGFNGTGYVINPVGPDYSSATEIALQPDGKLVLACNIANYGGLLRYTPSGALDSTFGINGVANFNVLSVGVNGMAMQPDGKFVVAGLWTDDRSGYLARFNANGTFDQTFGNAGQVISPAAADSTKWNAVAVLPDGRLQAAGFDCTSFSDPFSFQFALMRVSGDAQGLRLDPASDSGSSNTDHVTRITTPTFDAYVPQGYYARIYRNGTLASAAYLSGSAIVLPAQPVGTWSYTQTLVDAAGNESAPSAPVSVTICTAAPTAGNLNAPLIVANAPTFNFTVTYRDDIAVNVKSLGSSNILMTGPNGYSQFAKFISASPNASAGKIVATYQITRPAGGWGTGAVFYIATLQSNQICDSAGNFAASTLLGKIGVTPIASPQKPQLLAASDSGVNSTDRVTNFDNSSPARSLSFSVGGTVAGAKVTIYADGVAIGSATATGTITTVTASGALSLKTGLHQIAARQTSTGGVQSDDSPALSITIDTTAPAAALVRNAIAPGNAPAQFTVTYTDAIAVSVASLGNKNILVTGSNGYSQLATFLSAMPRWNSPTISVTYQITAPAAGWGSAGATYNINLAASQLSDIAANWAGAKTLGAIAVAKIAAPGKPVLLPVSDSGASSTDRITLFNNSRKAVALQFSIPSTIAGAVVTIYVDGYPIGSATATGTTTTVVTNGTFAIPDGVRSIIARQAVGASSSASSPALSITIDTTPPAIGAPTLDPASDSGTLGDRITNVGSPVVDVYVPEAGTIHVAAETGPEVTLTVSAPGTYKIQTRTAAGYSLSQPYSFDRPLARVVDINNDGKADVVTETNWGGLSVMLNGGNGVLLPPSTIDTHTGYLDIGAGNFMGTGYQDIVGTTYEGLGLITNVNGTLVDYNNFIRYTYPFRDAFILVVSDFNSDGRPDVVVAGETPEGDALLVMLNTGNSTFAQGIIPGLLGTPSSLTAADFNSDGKPDLAIATAGGVQVMLGRGGVFATPVTVCAGDTGAIAVGDFNSDGKLDLVAHSNHHTLSTFLGNNDGTFRAAGVLTVSNSINGAVAGDFNGDGKLDVASIFESPSFAFLIAYGNGDGTLKTPISYPYDGTGGFFLGAGDINGDARPDLLATTSSSLQILLTQGGPFAPGVHSIRVWETDVAGNSSTMSAALKITILAPTNSPQSVFAIRSAPRFAPAASRRGDALLPFSTDHLLDTEDAWWKDATRPRRLNRLTHRWIDYALCEVASSNPILL